MDNRRRLHLEPSRLRACLVPYADCTELSLVWMDSGIIHFCVSNKCRAPHGQQTVVSSTLCLLWRLTCFNRRIQDVLAD